ncbi:MAG: HAD-IC family P-type ATPase [Dehalococcoidia bacterium]|nr:HAD-IC family P-type ATPase [Dehalococcoidia bacterium]
MPADPGGPAPPWHALPGDAAASRLHSRPGEGLSPAEAAARLAAHGPNELPQAPPRPAWLRLLLQFHTPLVYLLIAAAAVTLFLQEWVDTGVIAAVVIANAIVGFVQESRAAGAIGALTSSVVTHATVVRDGHASRVPSPQLVPGDVVLLEPGDKVPADLRILHSRELTIEESVLTGEPEPATKSPDPVDEAAVLADRGSMAYASTLVSTGTATALVVATGRATEVGRIARLVATAPTIETPLTRRIARLGQMLGAVIVVGAVATLAIGLLRGEPAGESFRASVALAVAAIPEGLPAAMTITLAIGVGRMARRGAIIRSLPAVEALGSTTVICSDKTGTLTLNQMTVTAAWAAGQRHELPHSAGDDPSAPLQTMLRAGVLCGTARRVEREGEWVHVGDPTEVALLAAASDAGIEQHLVEAEFPRLDTVPFDAARKFMATLHECGGGAVIFLKGAPEAILPRCTSALDASGDARLPLDDAHAAVDELASEGLRVLAFAMLAFDERTDRIEHADIEGGLVLIGLAGLMDPPRHEVTEAVAACRRAGIAVKMITGDHALTASSIANRIGLAGPASADAIGGAEVDAASDDALASLVAKAEVFARVSPEGKLRLVHALQANGDVVAMTGDGVNDAPALRTADIGVAMGRKGTDAAREAADMVLTDDNFASIVAAVEEGRTVYDNLMKFLVWTLPTNVGEGLVIAVAIALGTELPMLPVQVLWVNMTTAVLLGLMLAFEPGEPSAMDRPPREPSAMLLPPGLRVRIVYVGAILLAAAFGLYELTLHAGHSDEVARTAAVNAFVFLEMAYLFNCRSLTDPSRNLGWRTNPYVLAGVAGMTALQLLYTFAPPMNRVFESAPMPAATWLFIAAAAIVVYVAVELEKRFTRRLFL